MIPFIDQVKPTFFAKLLVFIFTLCGYYVTQGQVLSEVNRALNFPSLRLGRSISSTETDIDTRLAKALTANDSLSVIWKSDLTDKIKGSFFQAAVVSILLYGCTT